MPPELIIRFAPDVIIDDVDEHGCCCCAGPELHIPDEDVTPERLESDRRSSGRSSFSALSSALGTSSPTRGFLEGGPSPMASELDIPLNGRGALRGRGGHTVSFFSKIFFKNHFFVTLGFIKHVAGGVARGATRPSDPTRVPTETRSASDVGRSRSDIGGPPSSFGSRRNVLRDRSRDLPRFGSQATWVGGHLFYTLA